MIVWSPYNLLDMSGILDSKTRILDSIVTLEGRRQLANGGINIRYVTFTDTATYYSADIVSGSADATVRLYLEACHLPQDQITLKSDNLGRITPFNGSLNLGVGIKSGQLLKFSFNPPDPSTLITGSIKPAAATTTLTGSSLFSSVEGLLTSSIDNFKNQHTIGSIDSIFDDDEFAIGNKQLEFIITDNRPIESADYSANINYLDDVYNDPRFCNLTNFKYMPPVNKIDESGIDKTDRQAIKKYNLGNYKPWGSTKKFNHLQVLSEHSAYAKMGYVRTINFDPTSRANNLFIQAFEVTNDTMFKMDIIDFGSWYTSPVDASLYFSNEPNQIGTTVKILFVGKLVLKPETNTHSFIHLFTLVFG